MFNILQFTSHVGIQIVLVDTPNFSTSPRSVNWRKVKFVSKK